MRPGSKLFLEAEREEHPAVVLCSVRFAGLGSTCEHARAHRLAWKVLACRACRVTRSEAALSHRGLAPSCLLALLCEPPPAAANAARPSCCKERLSPSPQRGSISTTPCLRAYRSCTFTSGAPQGAARLHTDQGRPWVAMGHSLAASSLFRPARATGSLLDLRGWLAQQPQERTQRAAVAEGVAQSEAT